MKFLDELSPSEREMLDLCRDQTDIPCPFDLGFWILEDGVPVPANPLICAMWMTRYSDLCRIAEDSVGPYRVSTVFSTVPLSWSGSAGVENAQHFETMVFSKDANGPQYRYRTLSEAKDGHARVVQQLKEIHG